jgi:hypothetical protein
MLLCGAQAAPPRDAPAVFADMLAAIRARDARAVEALSHGDIMLMRGYAIMPASELLRQLEGCTISSTRVPAREGFLGLIMFACPARGARVAPGSCDSGDLRLGATLTRGRVQLSLDEMRSRRPECLIPPPAVPARPQTSARREAIAHG